MPWPLIAAAAVQVGSSLYGGYKAKKAAKAEAEALKRQGAAEKAAADFEAGQMETQAGQEQAVAQRAMQEELRKARLLQSRALAVAGASGASVNDPTVLKILADIEAEGRFAAEVRKYEGDDNARKLLLNAHVRRWEGEQALQGNILSAGAAQARGQATAVSSILDAGSTALGAYKTIKGL